MDIDLAHVGAVLIVLAPLTLLLAGLFFLQFGENLNVFVPPFPEWEWPLGVQEEEPVRWRIGRLTTSGRQTSMDGMTATMERLGDPLADLRSKRVA